jgi:flagellar basal-body rod protein FlgF
MAPGLYAVVAGSLAQERRLDVLANNLANMSTAGFKADVPLFEVIPSPAASSVPGAFPLQSLNPSSRASFVQEAYVTPVGLKADLSPGEMRSTGNPLDLAINGKGWFSIQTPWGTRYTRNGSFTLDSQGQLVTHDGWPVMGNNGPITVQGNNVRIDPRGVLMVDGQEIDQLKIMEPSGDKAFQKAEGSLFAPKPGAGAMQVAPEPDVKQGLIELSNVNPIKGMTGLIDAMRAYESYQKALQTWSETTSRAVNDVGRLK